VSWLLLTYALSCNVVALAAADAAAGCRALVFVAKFFDSKVPAATAKGQEAADALGAAVAAKLQEYIAAMEKVGGLPESTCTALHLMHARCAGVSQAILRHWKRTVLEPNAP
jgi:hypothetical protein